MQDGELFHKVLRALDRLAREEPAFRKDSRGMAERNFQCGLQRELGSEFSERIVFREANPLTDGALQIDLCEPCSGLYIELKYRTRRLEVQWDGEPFTFPGPGSRDTGRYEFLCDIQRLECLQGMPRCKLGVAIFLTNDDLYWERSRVDGRNDSEFQIYQDRTIVGTMRWAMKASPGLLSSQTPPPRSDGREGCRMDAATDIDLLVENYAIRLKGSYTLKWRNYSSIGTVRGSSFRFLAVPISLAV